MSITKICVLPKLSMMLSYCKLCLSKQGNQEPTPIPTFPTTSPEALFKELRPWRQKNKLASGKKKKIYIYIMKIILYIYIMKIILYSKKCIFLNNDHRPFPLRVLLTHVWLTQMHWILYLGSAFTNPFVFREESWRSWRTSLLQ